MRALLALFVLVLPLLAGCIQEEPQIQAASVTAGKPYPFDAVFEDDGTWSRVLVPGPYEILDAEVVDMPSFDGTRINMGVFRPDVPEGVKVPVLIDAGPYYLDGDAGSASPDTQRLGGFLIENFVPHGYAVAQVSVRGTGTSGGCNDYLGAKEQRDLDAVVTYLAEQEWSNGNVAMIGRSYDGSTPWEVAAMGNEHLKTIVPISGITSLQQLHFRNGSSEARSLFLGSLYYSYGATEAAGGPEDDPTRAPRMACAEGPQHTPMGAYGYATGGGRGIPGPGDAYWSEREFAARVLENYEGSIFYVHGLQDWNVKPAQGVDVYNAFEGKKKALLGQWAHNYPDRPDEHNNLRWDWAEMLLRWFDQELKGVETDTGPAVEVQDQRGRWRAEPQNAWPPTDAEWTILYPDASGALGPTPGEGTMPLFAPAPLALADAPAPVEDVLGARVLTFLSEPFPEGALIAGMPQLHLTVTSTTPGGNLWAELYEIDANQTATRIGRAQMDLRYRDGGNVPQAYVPSTPVLAKMEFYPLNARLLPGSSLLLAITGEPSDLDVLPNPATARMDVTLGEGLTTLNVPYVVREDVASRWDVADTEVTGESA